MALSLKRSSLDCSPCVMRRTSHGRAQDLERQRLKSEIIARIEQDRAIRDGDDLWHQGAQRHVIAAFSLGWPDLPSAVVVIGDSHEDIEARINVEAPAIHAVSGDGGFEIRLAVRRLLALLAVARDVQVLAAVATATVILAREVIFDLPHLA